MITDVSRLRPHLCTIITSIAPAQIVGEDVELWRPSLTRDIRAKNAGYSMTSSVMADTAALLLLCRFSHHHEGSPEPGIGFGVGFRSIDHGEH